MLIAKPKKKLERQIKYMKNLFVYALLLAMAVSFTNFTCNKSDTDSADCIKVKLIANICGQAVFQILDEKHYNLGENVWKGAEGTTYDHVFFSLLSCDVMSYFNNKGITNNSELLVNIEALQEPSNCAVCLALLVNPPKKQQFISVCK